MGQTYVKGSDNRLAIGKPETVILSGNSYVCGVTLAANVPAFHALLAALPRIENWPIMGCAEVKAVADLTTAPNPTPLANIRIGMAVDDGLVKPPCRNCSQWLHSPDNNKIYQIRPAFLPVAPVVPFVNQLGSGGGSKPTSGAWSKPLGKPQ